MDVLKLSYEIVTAVSYVFPLVVIWHYLRVSRKAAYKSVCRRTMRNSRKSKYPKFD